MHWINVCLNCCEVWIIRKQDKMKRFANYRQIVDINEEQHRKLNWALWQPLTVDFREEQALFTITRCCLPFKYDVNQFNAGPIMPMFSIFLNKTKCPIESKAFLWSRKTLIAFFWQFNLNFLTNSTRASIVLCLVRIANWL